MSQKSNSQHYIDLSNLILAPTAPAHNIKIKGHTNTYTIEYKQTDWLN